MPTGSNLILGQTNTASDPTEIDVVPTPTKAGLVVYYPRGLGIVGSHALDAGLVGVGLRGVSGISINDVGVGVAGLGSRVGVAGDSIGDSSVGVRGPYHAFLSPEGDCHGLYVGRKSSGAIEVRESQGGRSSIRFSYRIVARRKDVAAPRFARINLPKMPTNADAPIHAPEPPKMPSMKDVRARVVAKPSTRSRRQRRRR
jgi:hypothetical protein